MILSLSFGYAVFTSENKFVMSSVEAKRCRSTNSMEKLGVSVWLLVTILALILSPSVLGEKGGFEMFRVLLKYLQRLYLPLI